MSDMFNFDAEPDCFILPYGPSEDIVFADCWAREVVQDYGYDEPVFNLFGYPETKQAPLSTTAGTESTSVSDGNIKKRKPRKSSASDVSSMLSFDQDISKLNICQIKPPTLVSEGGSSISYDQLLLKLVDDESLNFIIKQGLPLDFQLKEFIASILEVMTKDTFSPAEGLTDSEWVEAASQHIGKASIKRKDQKLRMIFNKIVKMLVVKSASVEKGRETKAARLANFANKYSGKDTDNFMALIRDCKFPSKKKLKNIFSRYPAFKLDFSDIINNNVFVNEYFAKRQKKAIRLVATFVEGFKKHADDRGKIVAVLRDCIKSFPWSQAELTSSCGLLKSTIDG